jgi:hypothetical protein
MSRAALQAAFRSGNFEKFAEEIHTAEVQALLADGGGANIIYMMMAYSPRNRNRYSDEYTAFLNRCIARILRYSPSRGGIYDALLHQAAHRGDADLVMAFLLKGARVDNILGTWDEFNPDVYNNPPLEPGEEDNDRIILGPSELPSPQMIDLIVLAHEQEEAGGSFEEYAEESNDPDYMLNYILDKMDGHSGGRKKRKGKGKTRKGKGRKGKKHTRRR